LMRKEFYVFVFYHSHKFCFFVNMVVCIQLRTVMNNFKISAAWWWKIASWLDECCDYFRIRYYCFRPAP